MTSNQNPIPATFRRVEDEWHVRLPVGTPRPATDHEAQAVVTRRNGTTELVWIDPSCWMLDGEEEEPDPATAPILARFRKVQTPRTSHPRRTAARMPLADEVWIALSRLGTDGRLDVFDGAWGIGPGMPSRQELSNLDTATLRAIKAEMAS